MPIDDLPSTILFDSANFDAEAAILGTDNNWMDLDDLEGDNELLQMVGSSTDHVVEDTTSEEDDFMVEDERELPPPASSPLPEIPVSSASLRRTDTTNVYPIQHSSSFDMPQQTRSFDSQASLPPRVTPSNSFDGEPQRVVPRRSVSCTSADNSVLLQMQYQEGMRRLSKSMRHSDMTRSVIKRQRKIAPSLSFTSTRSRDSSYDGTSKSTPAVDHQQDFFLGPRCKELEDSRKNLLSMLNPSPEKR